MSTPTDCAPDCTERTACTDPGPGHSQCGRLPDGTPRHHGRPGTETGRPHVLPYTIRLDAEHQPQPIERTASTIGEARRMARDAATHPGCRVVVVTDARGAHVYETSHAERSSEPAKLAADLCHQLVTGGTVWLCDGCHTAVTDSFAECQDGCSRPLDHVGPCHRREHDTDHCGRCDTVDRLTPCDVENLDTEQAATLARVDEKMAGKLRQAASLAVDLAEAAHRTACERVGRLAAELDAARADVRRFREERAAAVEVYASTFPRQD